MGGVAWSDSPALPGAFFTVLERDQMGDDRPDDLVARATKAGQFFGFPYCHREGAGDPYRRDPGPGGAAHSYLCACMLLRNVYRMPWLLAALHACTSIFPVTLWY